MKQLFPLTRRLLRLGVPLVGLATIGALQAGSFDTDFNAGQPPGTSVNGDAIVDSAGGIGDSGVLKLTVAENSKMGSFLIDDLDGGAVIGSFTASFKLWLGGGNAADGFSFNFAPDLPDAAFGEEGAGSGLTVEFDSYDNGLPDTAPTIDLKTGGVEVAIVRANYLRQPGFVDVTITAKADGTVSVTYAGNVVYNNYFAFIPTAGRFGLGARTGGLNDNHWVDDLRITTTPLSGPYVKAASPNGPGASAVPRVHIEIEDFNTAVNTASVQLQFDGGNVAATVKKTGTTTSVDYAPGVLPPSSPHTIGLSFADTATPPNTRAAQFAFAVSPYVTLPASAALASGAVDTSKPGFTVRSVQARQAANLANSLARTEAQLAGLLIDPTTTQPYVDMAFAGPNADGSYDEEGVINYDIGAVNDNFAGDTAFPGIPGGEGSTTDFAVEIKTYLQLQAGFYMLEVTSDDGFKLAAGPNPKDAFATILGRFDGGRGYADSQCPVVVEAAGVYPFRLIFEQGGGDANLEWWLLNQQTGEKILVNDTSNPGAVKAYRARKGASLTPAYIGSVSPAPAEPNVSKTPKVSILLVDDGTQVDTASVQLSLNGTVVAATVSKAGPNTTVTFQQTAPLPNVSTNTLHLVFKDNAVPPNVRSQDWWFVTARVINAVGQWDFDQGDLRATLGSDLEYGDLAGETAVLDHTSFGTTTSFGIPDIGGKAATVMKITRDETPPEPIGPHGYICRPGIPPNGGPDATKVNQWTLIFDMMIVDLKEGDAYTALYKIEAPDDFTRDGDIFIRGNDIGGDGTGGIGISGQYNGDGRTNLVSGQWHRIVIASDAAAPTAVLSKFVDGVKFQDQTSGSRWGYNQRHGLQDHLRFFADGEGDNELNTLYVNSIQLRDGKMSDDEILALGGPSADGIPVPNRVGAQWDFDQGDLRATVGTELAYGDLAGETSVKDHTSFGTTTAFGISGIGGQAAKVLKYTRDENAPAPAGPRGYIARHGLKPNGGGAKVNQWTMVFDVMFPDLKEGDAYSALYKVRTPDDFARDGDIFARGNDIGGPGTGGLGISGQYTGNGKVWLVSGKWHRIVVGMDENAGMLSKYIDGVKFQDQGRTDGVDGRMALEPFLRLFADGENDNEVNTFYVNSVQIRDGKLNDEQVAALGGPSAAGIPIAIPQIKPPPERPKITGIALAAGGVTISWAGAADIRLQSAASLTSPQWQDVAGSTGANSATVPATGGAKFFRLAR